MDLDYKHTIWSFFSLFLLNTIRLGDYVSRFVFSPIPFLSNIPSATGPLFETLLHPTLQTRCTAKRQPVITMPVRERLSLPIRERALDHSLAL
jgi:hypothetical protein